MRIYNALFLLLDKINCVSKPASINVGKYIDSKTRSSTLHSLCVITILSSAGLFSLDFLPILLKN